MQERQHCDIRGPGPTPTEQLIRYRDSMIRTIKERAFGEPGGSNHSLALAQLSIAVEFSRQFDRLLERLGDGER